MSANPQVISPEQYLEIDRAAQFRSEYYNGRMYAMSGGSFPHAVLIPNLARRLGNALEGRPCVVATTELRVRISPGGLYTYPDLVVICGEPRFADGLENDAKDTLLNPTVIIEVLSPSTEAYDRGWKFLQYRKIDSLREYVLVSQTEARIEVFRRQNSGDWLLSETEGMGAVCKLESLDCAIALAEVYDKVTFPENAGFRP